MNNRIHGSKGSQDGREVKIIDLYFKPRKILFLALKILKFATFEINTDSGIAKYLSNNNSARCK